MRDNEKWIITQKKIWTRLEEIQQKQRSHKQNPLCCIGYNAKYGMNPV